MRKLICLATTAMLLAMPLSQVVAAPPFNFNVIDPTGGQQIPFRSIARTVRWFGAVRTWGRGPTATNQIKMGRMEGTGVEYKHDYRLQNCPPNFTLVNPAPLSVYEGTFTGEGTSTTFVESLAPVEISLVPFVRRANSNEGELITYTTAVNHPVDHSLSQISRFAVIRQLRPDNSVWRLWGAMMDVEQQIVASRSYLIDNNNRGYLDESQTNIVRGHVVPGGGHFFGVCEQQLIAAINPNPNLCNNPLISMSVCGDGIVDSLNNESCDGGDHCDELCNVIVDPVTDPIIDLSGSICGNGTVDVGEQCDDSNTANDDGCSSECLHEVNTSPYITNYCGDGTVDASNDEQCDDGSNINGDGCDDWCQLETTSSSSSSEITTGTICGDSMINGTEECEDGNMLNGDGCSDTCELEASGVCSVPFCSNAIVEAGETCDDGNVVNNDGCTSVCAVESCGDWITQSSEQCDDGNTASGDGCTASCMYEYCGDSTVQGTETCDDGNVVNGDGCDSSCAIETTSSCGNWICDSTETIASCPSDCTSASSSSAPIEYCGDSIVQATETCDDGNVVNGDGCDSLCAIEL